MRPRKVIGPGGPGPVLPGGPVRGSRWSLCGGHGWDPVAQAWAAAVPSGFRTVMHHRVAGFAAAAATRSRVSAWSRIPNPATSPGGPVSPPRAVCGTVMVISAPTLGPPVPGPGPGPGRAAGPVPGPGRRTGPRPGRGRPGRGRRHPSPPLAGGSPGAGRESRSCSRSRVARTFSSSQVPAPRHRAGRGRGPRRAASRPAPPPMGSSRPEIPALPDSSRNARTRASRRAFSLRLRTASGSSRSTSRFAVRRSSAYVLRLRRPGEDLIRERGVLIRQDAGDVLDDLDVDRVELARGQRGEGDRQPPGHGAGVPDLPGRRQPGQAERGGDLVGGEVLPPRPGPELGQRRHLAPTPAATPSAGSRTRTRPAGHRTAPPALPRPARPPCPAPWPAADPAPSCPPGHPRRTPPGSGPPPARSRTGPAGCLSPASQPSPGSPEPSGSSGSGDSAADMAHLAG